MEGLALLTVVWIAAIAVYFRFTTERQRENYLLVAWIVLSIPVAIFLLMGLTR